MNTGDTILNVTKGRKERIGRLVKMHANKREEITEILAGDIAACVGLKGVVTGDTICSEDKPISLENITFPAPVIQLAIEPKTKADQEKLGMAIAKLVQEDGKDLPMKGYRLNMHLTPFFGDTQLAKITTFDVERYKKQRGSDESRGHGKDYKDFISGTQQFSDPGTP